MPSAKQLGIYDYIRAYADRTGRPPTLDEIRQAKGLSTKSLVVYHLKALAAAGLIEHTPNVSRGIRVLDPEPQNVTFSLPIKGWIRAGAPVLTDSVEEAIELTRDLVPQMEGLYGLRVRGDSMRDALVNDGDIVVLEGTSAWHDGDMVAAWIKSKEETTLKRIYHEGERIRLQPANTTMDPIYAAADDVEVQGRVLYRIGNF